MSSSTTFPSGVAAQFGVHGYDLQRQEVRDHLFSEVNLLNQPMVLSAVQEVRGLHFKWQLSYVANFNTVVYLGALPSIHVRQPILLVDAPLFVPFWGRGEQLVKNKKVVPMHERFCDLSLIHI